MKKLNLLISLLVIGSFASQARATRVLMVVTGANSINLKSLFDSQREFMKPTGYYLGELYEPLIAIEKAGFDVDIATPNGVVPVVDNESLKIQYWVQDLSARSEAIQFSKSDPRILKPLSLENMTSDEKLNEYVGLIIPGGHGPMVDLAKNPAMAVVLSYFHDLGKPTALICHGPTALLSLPPKNWPYNGYRLTVYDDAEERISEIFQLHGALPFFPEDELGKRGAIVDTSYFPFQPWVQRDRELITGQNPFSPIPFGRAVVDALKQYQKSGSLK